MASTREPSIAKHLYSTVDVSAAENIGRILARRCHQCGITTLLFDTVETPLTNESTKAFYEALLDGGVSLQEPDELSRPEPLGIDYDTLREEEKAALYPRLIDDLRSIPDWNSLPYPYSLRPKARKAKLRNQYQILSKIRQGMVWDSFYNRMVLPQNMAAWQHRREERQTQLMLTEAKSADRGDDEPVQTIVPKKWQL